MANKGEAAQQARSRRRAKAQPVAGPPAALQTETVGREAIDQHYEGVAARSWSIERLEGKATIGAYRDFKTGEWEVARHVLHEEIINRLIAGKPRRESPTLCLVMGGVGTGKSTLIESQLAPEHPNAVVIDADKLWLTIPEYKALAAVDWELAADCTYAEVRIFRDELLAEAAARRLDIILETSGDDDHLQEVARFMIRAGYETSVVVVDCPVEEARKRIQYRASHNPTPEDNLWTSPPRPDLPDKFDYQNVDVALLRSEYEKRKP